MTNLTTDLTALGDALEAAAAADLARASQPSGRRLPRRRLVAVAIAAAIAIPGIAIAADELISPDHVAASMPAGTLSLAGTEPTCTVVEQDVEYHCVLTNAPAPEFTDSEGNPAFLGTVEPTVDATKHVNGGCRSLTADGREWQCYIGQAAVDQSIIGASFLGEYAPEPGVG